MTGIALLFVGLTAVARVPRLTRDAFWRGSALLLDLVFVWHVYIRQSKAVERMREVVGLSNGQSPASSLPAWRQPTPGLPFHGGAPGSGTG